MLSVSCVVCCVYAILPCVALAPSVRVLFCELSVCCCLHVCLPSHVFGCLPSVSVLSVCRSFVCWLCTVNLYIVCVSFVHVLYVLSVVSCVACMISVCMLYVCHMYVCYCLCAMRTCVFCLPCITCVSCLPCISELPV